MRVENFLTQAGLGSRLDLADFPSNELPDPHLRLRLDFIGHNNDNPYPNVLRFAYDLFREPANLIPATEPESTTPVQSPAAGSAGGSPASSSASSVSSKGPGVAGFGLPAILLNTPARVATLVTVLLMFMFLQSPPFGDATGIPFTAANSQTGAAPQTPQYSKVPAAPEVFSIDQDRPWLGDSPGLSAGTVPLATGKGRGISNLTAEYNRRRAARQRGPSPARSYQLNNVEYLRRDFTYDGFERLRTEATSAPDNQGGERELSRLTHTYNIQHRRISTRSEFETPVAGLSGSVGPRQTTLDEYDYDAAGQLLTESFRDLTPDTHGLLASTTQNYTYDRAGNRLRSTQAELTRTFADDFTTGVIDPIEGPRYAGVGVPFIHNGWDLPAHAPALTPPQTSTWSLDDTTAPSGGLIDPTDLTQLPGILTHATTTPCRSCQCR